MTGCSWQGVEVMGNGIRSAQFLIESRLADAARGSPEACFDLGLAYSCGTGGVEIDFIEAHKWFNLAALGGNAAGQSMRAEIADEMTAREIAEAQRQARAWIAATGRRAA
jgi:TPR repeat protein